MHPTVKPVALVADAIKDCSRRGGLVLDPFCGSGTILIAAERTGRKARALEIDPAYVDVALRRWQTYTGKAAILAAFRGNLRDNRGAARRQGCLTARCQSRLRVITAPRCAQADRRPAAARHCVTVGQCECSAR
jgi:ribosomal protein L11 methylase PrmA